MAEHDRIDLGEDVEDRRAGKQQRSNLAAPAVVDAEALVKALAAQRAVPDKPDAPIPPIVRCSVTVQNHQHGTLPFVYQHPRDREARIKFDLNEVASSADAGEKKMGDTVRLTRAAWLKYGPQGVVMRKDI